MIWCATWTTSADRTTQFFIFYNFMLRNDIFLKLHFRGGHLEGFNCLESLYLLRFKSQRLCVSVRWVSMEWLNALITNVASSFVLSMNIFNHTPLSLYYDLNLLVDKCHYSVFTRICLFNLQWLEQFDKEIWIIGVLWNIKELYQ